MVVDGVDGLRDAAAAPPPARRRASTSSRARSRRTLVAFDLLGARRQRRPTAGHRRARARARRRLIAAARRRARSRLAPVACIRDPALDPHVTDRGSGHRATPLVRGRRRCRTGRHRRQARRRSATWRASACMVKVKHHRTADCVVGGYRRERNGDGVGKPAPRSATTTRAGDCSTSATRRRSARRSDASSARRSSRSSAVESFGGGGRSPGGSEPVERRPRHRVGHARAEARLRGSLRASAGRPVPPLGVRRLRWRHRSRPEELHVRTARARLVVALPRASRGLPSRRGVQQHQRSGSALDLVAIESLTPPVIDLDDRYFCKRSQWPADNIGGSGITSSGGNDGRPTSRRTAPAKARRSPPATTPTATQSARSPFSTSSGREYLDSRLLQRPAGRHVRVPVRRNVRHTVPI